MPEGIHLQAAASWALDPEVIVKIGELAELEFGAHVRGGSSQTRYWQT
jgi:hypothetical protein